jgi:signal transduction histidine kinase
MPSHTSTIQAEQDLARAIEELARELSEAHRREAATAEVLKAINRSTFDLQRVLDTLVETAARLCNAEGSGIALRYGEIFQYAALYATYGIEEYSRFLRQRTFTPGRDTTIGRVALTGDVVHIADIAADQEYALPQSSSIGKIRTNLGVPLLRDGTVMGMLTLFRQHVEPFTDRHIDLVKTFADQAVIAIENTRLFEAEQASKRELQESLDFQTATSEVLNVISRSPSNLQPVLDVIVQTAVRLCRADYADFRLHRDGTYYLAATTTGETAEIASPIAPGRASVAGRAALEGRTVHVPDVKADSEYTYVPRTSFPGMRTILGVPLLRDGLVIGVIVLFNSVVKPFTQNQIDLVTTFADQALIAIENTRLFEEVQARTRELTESLQQQTGTADVLKVISRSAFNLQSVLQALVESAARLCDADKGTITRQIDGVFYRAESYGFPAEVMERWRNVPVTPERSSAAGRALLEGRAVHVPDADADPDYTFDTAGARTMLGVPMLREGDPIGVLALARSDVRPFTDKQINLVSTFADQAAIAIENVRLFEEVQARTSELAKTVEDLEIASQHKNQFVANMSHELRTPLAAILGYAELIQEGFYEPQGPKSLDALTRIRSNGKHLLGLINTVLDIAKIESGQFTLNMSEYAIESVVETVRAATESLAQNKKLALKTEVAKSLPMGLGDEQRLTQVLLNLVGNAIKFTDAGEVHVTATAGNGYFNVSVTDTGPGIPVEHQTRIFEQFHQIDSSNTKAKGGTGLGLAIAKQIVEMHGGRIWVESTLGQGSTFQMELPTRAEFRKCGPRYQPTA